MDLYIPPQYGPFTPAGSGATPRTIQAKLREWISVKDFGAVGDGVADDTAEIQAALDAAAGAWVWFPRGTYKVSATLTVSLGGVYLVGESQDATKILSSVTNGDLIKFYHASGFTWGGVIGMTVQCSGVAAAGAGINISGVDAIAVDRVNIVSAYNGLLLEGDNQACRISAVDAQSVVNDSFVVNGGNNQYLHNCTAYQSGAPGGAGFNIKKTNGVWIDKCVSSLHTNGFKCAPVTGDDVLNSWVTACDFDASTGDGVAISTAGGGTIHELRFVGSRSGFNGGKGVVVTGASSRAVIFIGCTSEKNTEEGLRINGGDNIDCTGFQCLGNAASGGSYNGINVVGGDNVVITGGRSGPYAAVVNNQLYGLKVDAAFSGALTVTGMNLTGNATGGCLNSSSSSNIKIAGCAGYKNHAAGVATIPNGDTTAAVAHGMNRTPTTGTIGGEFASRSYALAFDATNVTVAASTAVGGDTRIWYDLKASDA